MESTLREPWMAESGAEEQDRRIGEVVAREERQRLRLGTAPIVNPAEMISDQGVWTAATDLPNGLSGLFVAIIG